MNMALQIFSTAALGATKIVAVMGAAHLDGAWAIARNLDCPFDFIIFYPSLGR